MLGTYLGIILILNLQFFFIIFDVTKYLSFVPT